LSGWMKWRDTVDALTSLLQPTAVWSPDDPRYGVRVHGTHFGVNSSPQYHRRPASTMTGALSDSLRIMAHPRTKWYWMLRRWGDN
jgi:hypothetical protein